MRKQNVMSNSSFSTQLGVFLVSNHACTVSFNDNVTVQLAQNQQPMS